MDLIKELELIERYNNGESSTILMNDYNLKYLNAVTDIVHKHNGRVRRVGTPQIITYNIEKFTNMFPETIYWMGFLYADGCLLKYKNTTYLQIALNIKDVEIINRFIEYFEIKRTEVSYPKVKLKATNKTYDTCKITISINKEIEQFISHFGIIKNKSKLEFCPEILNYNELLIKNFIRGYFDGDGGVCVFKKKNNRGGKYSTAIAISWLGNRTFLEWIQNKINQYLNEDSLGKIGKRTSIYGFSWGRHGLIKKFYEWIYNEGFCLKRKQLKIYNFLQEKDLLQ